MGHITTYSWDYIVFDYYPMNPYSTAKFGYIAVTARRDDNGNFISYTIDGTGCIGCSPKEVKK